MAFQVSPGVSVSEIDLTTVIPAVSTSVGAIAIQATWGPVGVSPEAIQTITSQDELVNTFGKPNSNNYATWFSAANFLDYANNLKVVRVKEAGRLNATSNAGGGSSTTVVDSATDFDVTFGDGKANTATFIAKWPGAIGSSLKVTVVDSNTAFNNATSGWTTGPSSATVSGNSFFDIAPGTSTWAAGYGQADSNDLVDELHVLVEDEGGLFTGTPGTVLEKYAHLSKASGALSEDGGGNYWRDVINDTSKYIWVNSGNIYQDDIDPSAAGTEYLGVANVGGGTSGETDTWGTHPSVRVAASSTYEHHDAPLQYSLNEGLDATSSGALEEGNVISAYDNFADSETVDVSLIIAGEAVTNVQKHIIQSIAEKRKDAIAFISPHKAHVQPVVSDSTTLSNVLDHRNDNLGISSSYATMDSGWKYQFDKYNNVYRWVPLNADIAGLCARTDYQRDAWWSPAGFNRGQIKNVVKLAWNPKQAHRDDLYRAGVNPVVTFPGQGTILYGDKTLQSKPSSFDRINVRRLFIVLEKAIATASKFSLFEFNDEFTRAQFRNMVEPFLRDIQGRRGIYDFKVVCDDSNNTAEVIDRNEFVGDIYIKPARSVNFIQLNFVAVRTGVDFSEIVGQF